MILQKLKFIIHLIVARSICFLRQNSKYSKKVFKISEGYFNQKEKQISKEHSFKQISTRKYYFGKHKIIIIINGEELVEKEFFVI